MYMHTVHTHKTQNTHTCVQICMYVYIYIYIYISIRIFSYWASGPPACVRPSPGCIRPSAQRYARSTGQKICARLSDGAPAAFFRSTGPSEPRNSPPRTLPGPDFRGSGPRFSTTLSIVFSIEFPIDFLLLFRAFVRIAFGRFGVRFSFVSSIDFGLDRARTASKKLEKSSLAATKIEV